MNGKSFKELRVAYNEYVAKSYAYLKAMICQREEEMKEAVRAYKEAMANLGFSEEQMKACIDGDAAMVSSIIEDVDVPDIPEALEVPLDNEEEPQALPEPTWEKGDVTLVEEEDSINSESKEEEESKVETASVWDHPALTAPYNPVTATKSEEPAVPEKTPIEIADEGLPSLEDLLSDDTEYKEYYAPTSPVKKSNRTLPTMDELLSGKPINRILCMGSEVPDDKAYKQHYRICHVDGIIPTELASGQTIIYIPPGHPVAA